MEECLDQLAKHGTWKSWRWGPGQDVFYTERSFRCKDTLLCCVCCFPTFLGINLLLQDQSMVELSCPMPLQAEWLMMVTERNQGLNWADPEERKLVCILQETLQL